MRAVISARRPRALERFATVRYVLTIERETVNPFG